MTEGQTEYRTTKRFTNNSTMPTRIPAFQFTTLIRPFGFLDSDLIFIYHGDFDRYGRTHVYDIRAFCGSSLYLMTHLLSWNKLYSTFACFFSLKTSRSRSPIHDILPAATSASIHLHGAGQSRCSFQRFHNFFIDTQILPHKLYPRLRVDVE